MAAVLQLEELRARFGMPSEERGQAKALPLALGWPEMDAALPEGGLPRGIVELASPHALGGGTSVALAAVRAAQAKDARTWCAWLDPEGTLYAPGVAMAGVDLARLLVVRPERADLGRMAVKVAAARACDVIVVDMDPVAGARAAVSLGRRKRKKTWPPEVLVRKLALLAASAGASVILLTDSLVPRATSWPVALRLELSRAPSALSVRVAKDRRGKSRLAKTSIPLRTLPSLPSSLGGIPKPPGA
jgi:recombination protein RecA